MPPRRGHPDVPAWTASRSSPCSTSTAPRRAGARARPVRGHLPPGSRRPGRHPAAAARGHLGGRLLPGGVGGAGAGRRGRRPGRADAHRRHRVAAPPGVAPRRPRRWCSTRPGGRRGARRRHVRRSRPTRRPPARAEPCCRGGGGCCSGSCCCSGRRPSSGLAGRLVWGSTKVLGREVQRASELVAELEAAPTSCVTSSPTRRGHPATSQDAGAVSGATGLGEGCSGRPSRRPAAAVGARTLTPDLARHATGVTRHHRRWTPWAGSDPPRSSSSRC